MSKIIEDFMINKLTEEELEILDRKISFLFNNDIETYSAALESLGTINGNYYNQIKKYEKI